MTVSLRRMLVAALLSFGAQRSLTRTAAVPWWMCRAHASCCGRRRAMRDLSR